MKKICAISTVEVTMNSFIIPAMRVMKEYGYDVTLVCNMSEEFYQKNSEEFHCINIPMKRGVSLTDLIKMPFVFNRISVIPSSVIFNRQFCGNSCSALSSGVN